MTLISTTTSSGNASDIQFTAIPSTFTDLALLVSARSSRTVVESGCSIVLNDTSSGYSKRVLFGTGSSAGSFSTSGESALYTPAIPGSSATSNTFGNSIVYFPNYAGSTAKSVSSEQVIENNATAGYQYLVAGLFSGTSAITKIAIFEGTGNFFINGSVFSLYGITKGSGGATVS
jgi:hypothetical protein